MIVMVWRARHASCIRSGASHFVANMTCLVAVLMDACFKDWKDVATAGWADPSLGVELFVHPI